MTDIHTTPEAQVVADLAAANQAVHIATPTGENIVLFATRSGDFEAIDLQEYSDGPRASRSLAEEVYDRGSFVDYLNRFAEAGRALIRVDRRSNRIVAVLDYLNGDYGRGWRSHTVTLALTPTVEWQRWERFSSVQMHRQDDFAEFIEAQMPTFIQPDGATMLEIAQSVQGTSTAQWQKATRLSNGETKFEFVEDVEAKAGRRGDIEIPQAVTVGLQPYEGSPRYQLTARLRYRVSQGALALGLLLHRPEDVRDKAFGAVLDEIDEDLEGDYTIISGPIR